PSRLVARRNSSVALTHGARRICVLHTRRRRFDLDPIESLVLLSLEIAQRRFLIKRNIQLANEWFETRRCARPLEESKTASLVRQTQQRALSIRTQEWVSHWRFARE